jgi:hypothetical protein
MIGYNLIASPGRLANQMFKYAALKGISKNMGYEYCIPPSYPIIEKNKLLYKTTTKYLLKRNKHNHKLFSAFQMKSLNKVQINYLSSDELIQEKSFEFDEEIFNNCPDDINIWGFFQSEKYFSNVRESILDDFSFKKKFREKAKLELRRFESPISIHIRRSDYLTNENHSPLGVDYYDSAISNYPKNSTFLIFTDDVSWVKNQKLFKQNNMFVMSELLKNNYLDLCSMTMCDSHIIANSSFSWWGAWLSKQKKVIAPKYWFKNSKLEYLNTKDLIPSNWIKVDN